MKSPEWIDQARAGGLVSRAHTRKMVGSHNVAEHSHGVAIMCVWLTEGECSARLLKAALFHDLAEFHTGDVPAPTKWMYPILKQELDTAESNFAELHGLGYTLTEDETAVLKFADIFDLMLFCRDQLMMGNRFAIEIYDNCVKWFESVMPMDARVMEMYNHIVDTTEVLINDR